MVTNCTGCLWVSCSHQLARQHTKVSLCLWQLTLTGIINPENPFICSHVSVHLWSHRAPGLARSKKTSNPPRTCLRLCHLKRIFVFCSRLLASFHWLFMWLSDLKFVLHSSAIKKITRQISVLRQKSPSRIILRLKVENVLYLKTVDKSSLTALLYFC